jgi:hypothetical protein
MPFEGGSAALAASVLDALMYRLVCNQFSMVDARWDTFLSTPIVLRNARQSPLERDA